MYKYLLLASLYFISPILFADSVCRYYECPSYYCTSCQCSDPGVRRNPCLCDNKYCKVFGNIGAR